MPYQSKRFSEYFGGLSLAVFDIETSGLSPTTSKCILGGALLPHEDHIESFQFFAESKKEEPGLLLAYCELLAKADVLISYNGNRFDLPFLKARLAHHGLSSPLQAFHSFDLYRAVNHYSRFRDFLPNLKQKTVETYLGIGAERKDEISGEESVKLYEEYLRSGSITAKEKILLHNRDDLVQLNRLVSVLDKLDLHRILYYEGFPIAVSEKRAFLNSIGFGTHTLKATAATKDLPKDYYCFEAGHQASHLAATHSLTVEVPYETLHGSTYVDLSLFPFASDVFKDSSAEKSGYLILKDESGIRFSEVNRLLKELIVSIFLHL